MSSAASVSRRTGRRPLRATPHPARDAAITPAIPKIAITRPSLSSVCSLDSSDCATTNAMPFWFVGTAATRKSPSLVASVRQE